MLHTIARWIRLFHTYRLVAELLREGPPESTPLL